MELLEQVESYLARTRVPSSTFGRVVVGDPGFVRDLRAGRHPRRRTEERVRNYLKQVSALDHGSRRTLAAAEDKRTSA